MNTLALLSFIALLGADVTSSRSAPSDEFYKHRVVQPRIYHSRTKRQITTSRAHSDDGPGHPHDLTVVYNLDGRDFVLDLRLNRELLPREYFERHQHQGNHVVNQPSGRDVQLCQYQGDVRGRSGSWVAVSTCNGIRGVVFDGKELHYVEPGSDGKHFLYKHSDIRSNQTNGISVTSDHNKDHQEFNRIHRYKRNADKIRGPYNSNRQSRYVELMFVVDKETYRQQGESLPAVYQRCKDIANIMNALYTPLNIFIALVGVEVWTETDMIALQTNGDRTLSNFLAYRRKKLIKDHPNDVAQLFTHVQFEGGVFGKSLKGPICTSEFSGGVIADSGQVVGLLATTAAHELGHNFGMEHDNEYCNCPDVRCIMSSFHQSQNTATQWSSCSKDSLTEAFIHGMDHCLRNKPTRLFDSPVCGNGFVEAGEECDCGREDLCNNTCCNASTCKLHVNATCATGECCDLKTCRPKTAASECRPADLECDLPEYCSGHGEFCPDDVFKRNGEICDGGNAFCWQGSCRTHSDQCKRLWGPTGRNAEAVCYQFNILGSRQGNCGYNYLNQSYTKCNQEDINCGRLHCQHLNERLEYGMESVSILSNRFVNTNGSSVPCRTAIVDLGLSDVDPGLVPDGAKCGADKMCVKQKCVPVVTVRRATGGCSMDCNGNGVCDSRGQCHCNAGFSQPNCVSSGSAVTLPLPDVPTQAPGKFTVLQVISSTAALLSWDPVQPATLSGHFEGYKIQTWTDKDGDEGLRETIVNGDATRHLVTKFVPYSRNYARVLAYNGRHNGPPSETISVDTPEGVPGTVQFFEAHQLGSSALYLVWKEPEHPNGILTGYRIYYQSVKGTKVGPMIAREPHISNPKQTRAKLAGLEPGTKYRLHISGTTRAGEGSDYLIEHRTRANMAVQPDTPQFDWFREASDNGYASIKVVWLPNTDGKPGSHFFVKYKQKSATKFEETGPQIREDYEIVRGLMPGHIYELRIVAVDGQYMTESEIKEVDTSANVFQL